MMKPVGKPDAGNLHVRFDERGEETERVNTRDRASPRLYVRPEGACHQWRKVPPRELSIDLVADEQFGRAIGRTEAS
jgi:hypothetical protein